MSAAFIVAGVLMLAVGGWLVGLFVQRAMKRPDVEPDCRPVNIPAPKPVELAAMANGGVSYSRWLGMSEAEKARRIDEYYKAIGAA